MRSKMPRIERAAQFAPFDSLKGLHEALRAKEAELERTDKKEVPEDRAKEISAILSEIKKGDETETVYYRKDKYLTATGKTAVDFYEGVITVTDSRGKKEDIPVEDIYDIKIVKKNLK